MPYIQKIELSNDKNMLFVLTDKQYEDLKENQVDYEYEHESTYRYYTISMKKSAFEYINDYIYKLILNTESIVIIGHRHVNIKSKEEPRYKYFITVDDVMHGDADFYTTETFVISEETYNIIEKYGLTIDFKIYDKSDSYGNNYIDFSFASDDFQKCDMRFRTSNHYSNEHSNFKMSYALGRSAVENIVEEFENDNQKIVGSAHYVESLPTTYEVDIANMPSKTFFFNKSHIDFGNFVRFAIENMLDQYCIDEDLKKECDDFDFDYHLFSLYESGEFGREFDIEEFTQEYYGSIVETMFNDESYEKYKEHVMNNNLPKVKEQFPLLYEMFSFDKITEAFLNSGRQWE